MATRATYDICGTVFYCHWDGYPAGAADRLAKMIAAATQPGGATDCIATKRGGWAFAFIRGNDDAEPATSHDEFGDTDWRYTVREDADAGVLIAVASRNLSTDTWRTRGEQSLAHFIATERGDNETPPIVTVVEPTRYSAPRPILATLEHAEAIAQALWLQGSTYDEGNPNRAGYLDRAEAWRAAAAPVRKEETARRHRAAIAAVTVKAA